MVIVSTPSLFASTAKGGQDLGGEPLELGELIVADEPDAQVGDAGGGVATKGRDHDVGGAETHRTAHVDAAAIVGREEFGGDALGRLRIVFQPDGRVDAEGEVRESPAM